MREEIPAASPRLREYIVGTSRFWPVIAACGAIGAAVMFATTPAAPTTVQRSTSYVATGTLLARPAVNGVSIKPSLGNAKLFMTRGEVPLKVSAKAPGNPTPGEVLAKLTVTTNAEAQSIDVAVRDSDPKRAEDISGLVIDEFQALQVKQQEVQRDERVKALDERVKVLGRELGETQGPDPVSTARRTAITRQFTEVFNDMQQLKNTVPESEFVVLQRPVAVASAAGGFVAPVDKPRRIGLGLIAGLGLGTALAFFFDRFDRRLRGISQVERTLGAPVVAVVPSWRDDQGDHDTGDVGISAAEGLRGLRAAISNLAPEVPGTRDERLGGWEPGDKCQVVAVCAARRGHLKSWAAANVAVAFAEAGQRTVVLDADVRNPQQWRYFGKSDRPGVSDALTSETPMDVRDLLSPTTFHDVFYINAGKTALPTLVRMERFEQVLAQLSQLVDVVIVDVPALLESHDSLDLLPLADTTVPIIRERRTTKSEGAAMRSLFQRLGVPVTGIALLDAKAAAPRVTSRQSASRGKSSRRQPDAPAGRDRSEPAARHQAPREPVPAASDHTARYPADSSYAHVPMGDGNTVDTNEPAAAGVNADVFRRRTARDSDGPMRAEGPQHSRRPNHPPQTPHQTSSSHQP